MQSRLNYLSNNLVKAGDSDKENDELEEEKAAGLFFMLFINFSFEKLKIIIAF